MAVGAQMDDDGGSNHGAVWVLFLDAVGSASAQIADMLDFVEMAVAEGSLAGNGPGGSGSGRLNALISQIETAGDLVEAGMIDEACDQLQDAFNRTDGESPPPDFVAGDAAMELALLISILQASLGCD